MWWNYTLMKEEYFFLSNKSYYSAMFSRQWDGDDFFCDTTAFLGFLMVLPPPDYIYWMLSPQIDHQQLLFFLLQCFPKLRCNGRPWFYQNKPKNVRCHMHCHNKCKMPTYVCFVHPFSDLSPLNGNLTTLVLILSW